MVTNLVSRKTIRQNLVTLFTATTAWNDVYGFIPQPDIIDNNAPVLFIASGGTAQEFAASAMNPSAFSFVFDSFTLLQDGVDWDAEDAENRIDDLDEIVRQTLRDNIGQVAWADDFEMVGDSTTGYLELKGGAYRTEQWIVLAKMYSGGA